MNYIDIFNDENNEYCFNFENLESLIKSLQNEIEKFDNILFEINENKNKIQKLENENKLRKEIIKIYNKKDNEKMFEFEAKRLKDFPLNNTVSLFYYLFKFEYFSFLNSFSYLFNNIAHIYLNDSKRFYYTLLFNQNKQILKYCDKYKISNFMRLIVDNISLLCLYQNSNFKGITDMLGIFNLCYFSNIKENFDKFFFSYEFCEDLFYLKYKNYNNENEDKKGHIKFEFNQKNTFLEIPDINKFVIKLQNYNNSEKKIYSFYLKDDELIYYLFETLFDENKQYSVFDIKLAKKNDNNNDKFISYKDIFDYLELYKNYNLKKYKISSFTNKKKEKISNFLKNLDENHIDKIKNLYNLDIYISNNNIYLPGFILNIKNEYFLKKLKFYSKQFPNEVFYMNIDQNNNPIYLEIKKHSNIVFKCNLEDNLENYNILNLNNDNTGFIINTGLYVYKFPIHNMNYDDNPFLKIYGSFDNKNLEAYEEYYENYLYPNFKTENKDEFIKKYGNLTYSPIKIYKDEICQFNEKFNIVNNSINKEKFKASFRYTIKEMINNSTKTLISLYSPSLRFLIDKKFPKYNEYLLSYAGFFNNYNLQYLDSIIFENYSFKYIEHICNLVGIDFYNDKKALTKLHVRIYENMYKNDKDNNLLNESISYIKDSEYLLHLEEKFNELKKNKTELNKKIKDLNENKGKLTDKQEQENILNEIRKANETYYENLGKMMEARKKLIMFYEQNVSENDKNKIDQIDPIEEEFIEINYEFKCNKDNKIKLCKTIEGRDINLYNTNPRCLKIIKKPNSKLVLNGDNIYNTYLKTKDLGFKKVIKDALFDLLYLKDLNCCNFKITKMKGDDNFYHLYLNKSKRLYFYFKNNEIELIDIVGHNNEKKNNILD